MKFFIFLLVSLISSFAWAQNVSKIGTTAALFLTIDTGARTAGMGSTFVANENDATGVHWNPAGLALISKSQATYSPVKWMSDYEINNYQGTLVLGKYGVVSVQSSFFRAEMTNQDLHGTGSESEASSKAIGITYSRQLPAHFAIGLSCKHVKEQIYHSDASCLTFDYGLIFSLPAYGIQVGASYSNLGGKMKMSGRDILQQIDVDPLIDGNNNNINASLRTDEYDIPRTFRYYAAIDLLRGLAYSNLNVAFGTIIRPLEKTETSNLGLEYVFYKMLYLRLGYLNLAETDYRKTLKTQGFGFRIPWHTFAAKFDWAQQERDYFPDFKIYSFGFEYQPK